MAFKRVLVLMQVGVANAPPKPSTHLQTKLRQTKSESVGKHNTLSLFATIFSSFFIMVTK